MQSSIRGNGNESGTVTALTFLKSVQKREEPSDFGVSKHGELHELLLGFAKPFSFFLYSLFSLFFHKQENNNKKKGTKHQQNTIKTDKI